MTTFGIIVITILSMLLLLSYICGWYLLVKLENRVHDIDMRVGKDDTPAGEYRWKRTEPLLKRVEDLERNSYRTYNSYSRINPNGPTLREFEELSDRVDNISEDVGGMDNRIDEIESRVQKLEVKNVHNNVETD